MMDNNNFDMFWDKYQKFSSTHEKVIDVDKIKWINEYVIPIAKDYASDMSAQFHSNFSLNAANIEIRGEKLDLIKQDKAMKEIICKSDNCTLLPNSDNTVALQLHFNVWNWRICRKENI